MVVTQLWATQQKRLQSQPGGRIWFGPKSKFWLRQFREKPIKSFCKPLIFLKYRIWNLAYLGSVRVDQMPKFHYCPWLYQLPLYLNIFACLSNWWNDMLCVLRLQDQHYTDNQFRKTYVNSYILSQKSSWRKWKCRHIFWVIWKSFNSLKEAISFDIQWVSCLR